MRIYPVKSRTVPIVSAAFVTGLAVILFVILGLPVLLESETELGTAAGRGRLVVTAVFCLFFLWAAWSCLRQVTAIRMGSDGRIEFARLAGSTRITARDIRSLEGKVYRDEDGAAFWRLKIRYSGGRVTVNQFRNVMDFVTRIRTHYPGVELRGDWPMEGLPPPVR